MSSDIFEYFLDTEGICLDMDGIRLGSLSNIFEYSLDMEGIHLDMDGICVGLFFNYYSLCYTLLDHNFYFGITISILGYLKLFDHCQKSKQKIILLS